MKNAHLKIKQGIVAGAVILLLLVACTKTTPTADVPTIPPTTVVSPTSTSTPASLLVVDPGAKAPQEVLDSLQTFASSNTLTYWTNADLNTDLSAVKIAIVFGEAGAFKEQAAGNSGTQFLFVGATSETSAGNINLVNNRPQDMVFLAGYLATLVAEDWRSGGLLDSGSTGTGIMGDAFTNGGAYACGLCTPVYPPYMSYPVFQDVSGKTTAAEIQIDAAALNLNEAETVFVAALADLPEVLDTLEVEGATLIGDNPTSANNARYAALLGYDVKPAIEALLPKLLASEGGQSAVSRVVLVSVNDSGKITPARQDLFNKAAEALADGWIIPLSVP